jgi:REP element-mobilizing transposase RayT
MKPFRYPFREKKHRLDAEIYAGKILVSFTLCVLGRKPLFDNLEIFQQFELLLRNELTNTDCSAYVYLFMPDHAHILLSGNSSHSDIKKCLDKYKQKTGFWLYKNTPDYKWQKDYYDHILRKEEDSETHIKYILNNPIRAGLVENWKQYKFKGSTVYDLDEWE